MKKRWVLGAFFALVFVLGLGGMPGFVLAKAFVNAEKHYSFNYDDAIFDLVSPGFLTTDAVLRKKQDESGFFPNMVVISRLVPPSFMLEEELSRAKTEYSKIFPGLVVSRQEQFSFKGYPGYVMELSYSRDDRPLFLRAIFVLAPGVFVNFNVTSPVATQDANLALFLPVLNTLDIGPSVAPAVTSGLAQDVSGQSGVTPQLSLQQGGQ